MLPASASAQQVNSPLSSNESGIYVSTGDVTSCSYRFLRPVTVTIRPSFVWDKTPDIEASFEKLGKAGRKVGADAVVLVEAGTPHFSLLNIRAITVTGRAISFVDKVCSPINRAPE